MKKLSVITINYNNRDGLRKTIESVVAQTTRDFEYIVIDGGSTDGSVDVIKEYASYIDYWVSEPDKGIYNAMNKGVRMASGDYISYVNSSDLLHDGNVLVDSIEFLSKHFDQDIIFGKVLDVYKSGQTHLVEFKHELTLMSLYYGVVNHTGTFIRREVQLKHLYREDLKICSDRQFFIEAIILDNCTYCHLDRVVTIFDKTGISSDGKSGALIEKENEQILDAVIPPRIALDYRQTNLMLQPLTSRMRKFYGLSKVLIYINLLILKIYSNIFCMKNTRIL